MPDSAAPADPRAAIRARTFAEEAGLARALAAGTGLSAAERAAIVDRAESSP